MRFIALADAWMLDGLRRAGVRPRKIRPGLDELKRQFGSEYVLMAPELATDGVDLLWDFSRVDRTEAVCRAREDPDRSIRRWAPELESLTAGPEPTTLA